MKRDSRFELLRIIAMYLIILHHLCLHTVEGEIKGLNSNHVFEILFFSGGKIGVAVFVLITGYFQGSKYFKADKLFGLEKKIYLYMILGFIAYLLMVKHGMISFDIWIPLKTIMPITFSAYWYMTAFVALYLLAPFINLCTKMLSIRVYKVLLLIMFLNQSVWPTFFHSNSWVNDLTWFIFLYLVGSYIKKYEKKVIKVMNFKRCIRLIIVSLSAIVTFGILISLLSSQFPALTGHENYMSFQNSTFVFFVAISLFCIISEKKSFNSKKVNTIGSATTDVYLIQSNPVISAYILWPLIKSFGLQKSLSWPLYAILLSLIIFLFCFLLSLITNKILQFIPEPAFINKMKNKMDKMYQPINELLNQN